LDSSSIRELSDRAIGTILKLAADAELDVQALPPAVFAECQEHGFLYRFDDLGPIEFFFYSVPVSRATAYSAYTELLRTRGGRA
jgi:hypothetical protein